MNYTDFCHSERSEESRIRLNTRIPVGGPEMFESLASCFAFRCSASLNMTDRVARVSFHEP